MTSISLAFYHVTSTALEEVRKLVKVNVNQKYLEKVVKVDYSSERKCLVLIMKDGSEVYLNVKTRGV